MELNIDQLNDYYYKYQAYLNNCEISRFDTYASPKSFGEFVYNNGIVTNQSDTSDYIPCSRY